MSSRHPIIIVTGANGGVGYGICQRLLLNLCGEVPGDALPQPEATPGAYIPCDYIPWARLTLIMACRSAKRAGVARDNLLKFLDDHIAERKRQNSPFVKEMDEFRKNLKVDILILDLASSQSTLNFCQEVTQKYPYISHAIWNAGYAPWNGIEWLSAIWAVLKSIKTAVTYPQYQKQLVGVLSKDQYGLTFQSNVLGHFFITRALDPLMKKSPWPTRVVWTSSLETTYALKYADWNDPQLITCLKPYGMCKFQTQLVAHYLDLESSRTRHFVTHPGVTSTGIFLDQLNIFTAFSMLFAFYIARLLGSVHHPISWINGAIAATHVSLVASPLLNTRKRLVIYGSRATLWGKAYVGGDDIDNYADYADKAKNLVDYCDKLYATQNQRFAEQSR